MTAAFDPVACERQFVEFFEAVYCGRTPFPWQKRLAVRVCDPKRGWPRAIDLPTAAGKTACIDIAVFALAYRTRTGHPRTAPRRIFFVVDRRIVVDQAYEHARCTLAPALSVATTGVLRTVADTLRSIGQEDRPLDVYALRGGMYREDTWIRSPLQPTVITSTVDQVGSRLLFRGYGVSDGMKPIHAGLVGNDALILLDEAHVSRPFAETATAVERFRGWHAVLAPFAFVQMTATPAGGVPDDTVERDQDDDRSHAFLGKRINASKPVALLVTSPIKGKNWRAPLVTKVVEAARGLMGRDAEGADVVRSVGVVVNRVATARDVHAGLLAIEKDKPEGERAEVILLTGRMRPLDRDAMLHRLRPLFTGGPGPERPTFVVATQCLEVGADLDLHALVSECASLDALRQRFGRLNRHAQERTFAPGAVVVRADQVEGKEDDVVYGPALANTWKWLRGDNRDAVDFGVSAMRTMTADVDLPPLNAPASHAPMLLPAHLDCWVQTAPMPALDPNPALYLHGPASGPPDVRVVFRADLGDEPERWADVVSLCPPSSSEALPVRLGDFKKWLAAEEELPGDLADVEGSDRDEETPAPRRVALRWAGPDNSALVEEARDVWPNGTYVVPTAADGIDLLGDIPPEGETSGLPADHGDAAFQRSRDRAVLRLTGGAVAGWPETVRRSVADALGAASPAASALHAVFEEMAVRYDDGEDVSEALAAGLTAITGAAEWLPRAATALRSASARLVARHPSGGLVLTGKTRLRRFDPTFADDESSESPRRRQVTLEQHTRGVMAFAERFATGCGLSAELVGQFAVAARWHDLGKADPRFQAMLRGGSPRSAVGRELLAKSGAAPATRREREEARSIHLYPKGGRHELLSLGFAAERSDDPLILHLIATHHGDARPFAAPYEDETRDRVDDLTPTGVELWGERFAWPRVGGDPFTANETAPDRFWRVVRKCGWWAAAYLESVFRLADHAASRTEQEENWKPDPTPVSPSKPLAPPATRSSCELPLRGLDGSNPLAFLAALGVLRCLSEFARRTERPEWLAGDVKLSWGHPGAPFAAVVHLPAVPTAESFADVLADGLVRDMTLHPAALAVALAEGKDATAGERLRALVDALTLDRCGPIDWAAAHHADLVPKEGSQLLIVRSDYLRGNVQNILTKTTANHLRRAVFARWDYADGLDNQSLHWEPSEDRRHAYQWYQPNGDRTKKWRGGMLGANRLALEAWPLFLSLPNAKKLRTRGFKGDDSKDTFWTWPLWSHPRALDAVPSLLALAELQEACPQPRQLRAYRVFAAFRSQRILVGKTPNLTPAVAL